MRHLKDNKLIGSFQNVDWLNNITDLKHMV